MTSKIFKDIVRLSKQRETFDFNQSLRQGRYRVFVLLILCNKYMKNYSAMMQTAFRAIKNEDLDKDVFFYYAGEAAYHLKLYGKAVELLYQYTSKHPNHWQPLHYLDLSLRSMGQQSSAVYFGDMAQKIKKIKGSLIEEEINDWRVQFF